MVNSLRFEVTIVFPAKIENSMFPPKGQRNVGRCGEERVLANMAALGARGANSREPAQTDDHHDMAAIENLSLTMSKMMSRWTGNRYIHVSMYS